MLAWLTDPDPRARIAAARKRLAGATDAAAKSAIFSVIAHSLVELGDLAGARREWLRLAKRGAGAARAAIEAGLLAEQDGKRAFAEADYKRAARLATGVAERAEAITTLARFYVRQGDAQRGLKFLRDNASRAATPLMSAARAYVEARVKRDPAPLARQRSVLERFEKQIPIFGYFRGFLELWDGRTLDALKAFRSFVSRGVDAATTWGRELAPEIDHARRTILQIEAVARVPMP